MIRDIFNYMIQTPVGVGVACECDNFSIVVTVDGKNHTFKLAEVTILFAEPITA